MDNARLWKEMYETSNDLHKLDIKSLKEGLEKALLLLREGTGYRSADWYHSVYSLLQLHNIKFDRYD